LWAQYHVYSSLTVLDLLCNIIGPPSMKLAAARFGLGVLEPGGKTNSM
jgi:hypothetical protein